jgi:hypothetical protein
VQPNAETLEEGAVVRILGLAGGVKIDDSGYDQSRIRGRYPR